MAAADTNAPNIPPAEEPKKFIRTFASDMKSVREGKPARLSPLGGPGPKRTREDVLASLKKQAEATAANVPEKPSAPPPPPPPPPEGSSINRLEPVQTTIEESAYTEPSADLMARDTRAAVDRLVGASPLAAEPPPVAAPSTPVESVLSAPLPAGPSPIHTYAEDFSGRIEATGASKVSVLAAQADAGAMTRVEKAPVRRSYGALYVIAGIVLLLAGGAGAYYAYTAYRAKTGPVVIAPTSSTAPIFVEEREQLSGSGSVLMQAIEQSSTRALAQGTVRLLYESGATTTGHSVFSALQLGAPDILLRNVNAAGSMAGIVNASGVQSAFFILNVASYGDTFSGMLAWEPRMMDDLGPLFPSASAMTLATTTATSTNAVATAPQKKTAATSSAKDASPIGGKDFHDVVIGNHDARAYLDAAGDTRLVYGYWDQHTLIIAHDAAAFSELLDRLATSRTAP